MHNFSLVRASLRSIIRQALWPFAPITFHFPPRWRPMAALHPTPYTDGGPTPRSLKPQEFNLSSNSLKILCFSEFPIIKLPISPPKPL